MANDDRPLFEKPLEDLLPPDPPKRARLAKDDRRQEYDLPPRALVTLARYQKWMLLMFVLQLLLPAMAVCLAFAAKPGKADTLVGVVGFTLFSCGLAAYVARIVFMYLLAFRLFETRSVVIVLLVEIVCWSGVVTLLVVNARTTSTLKRNGIRVGLLGAREADLPKVEQRETTLPKLGW